MTYRRHKQKVADYIVVKNRSAGYVTELRRQAIRAGMGRVIVLDAMTTMVSVSKSHNAKWIERFAKDNRATILERNAQPPETTHRAACGVELLSFGLSRRHEGNCKRCKGRVSTNTVTASNGGANIDPDKLDPGPSVRPPKPEPIQEPEPIQVTVDVTAATVEAAMTRIIDRSLVLAGEVELALRTVSRRAEIEAEIEALQAEYEGLIRDTKGANPFTSTRNAGNITYLDLLHYDSTKRSSQKSGGETV
jgi:hypothetical protein